MEKKTLFTEIPVFQGGMGIGVSLGGLAGAVAACGGGGTISAAQIGFQEPDFRENPLAANLRAIGKEIRKAKEIAKGRGAVGMNVMVAASHYGEYVKESIRQGIDFIVSGAGLPMDLPALAGDAKVKLIPVVSSWKAARVICRRWWSKHQTMPDAVLIEGPLAGGHLGFDAETADRAGGAANQAEYEEEIKKIILFLREFSEEHGKYIPVITAGGYGSHEDLLHQQELGADALQLATRFVVTEECDAHRRFKQAYIDCRKEDIAIIKSPVGMPGRAIRNSFIRRAQQERIPPKHCFGCLQTCKPSMTPYCITQALIEAVKGNLEQGLIFCGANAWREDRIRTVQEVIREILEEKAF